MLTEQERYYLARFLSERYDISLERATDRIEEPEVDSLTEYQFVSSQFHLDSMDTSGKLSDEFVERENQLHYLTKAYTNKRPARVSGYMELLQETAEKETELKFDQTNTWYTDDQLEEITYELEYHTGWVQQQVYKEENVSSEFKHLYDLTCSLMLYALMKNGPRVSVDYKNAYRALRKGNQYGYVEQGSLDSYARSIGMRLAGVFTSDKDESKSTEEQEELQDTIMDSLAPHYTGPIRQLVKSVEWAITEHYSDPI